MAEQELKEKGHSFERTTDSLGGDYLSHITEWFLDRLLLIILMGILFLPVLILLPRHITIFIALALITYSYIDYAAKKEDEKSSPMRERFLSSYSDAVGELTTASRDVARRIAQLYDLKETRHLLPHPLGLRLLDTYNKQSASLSLVNARLLEIDKYYQLLKQRLEQLKQLQDTNEAGERSLKELEEDRLEILSLKERIEASSHNLEAILDTLEVEAKKRVLHREVTQLANAASRASANDPVEGVMSDRVDTLEQQITSEITHYLQMEREIEQRLG